MKKQYVIKCVDTGKYYTGRYTTFWSAEVRDASFFNNRMDAEDTFINSINEEDYDGKFVDHLPDNPIFIVEELITKEYL